MGPVQARAEHWQCVWTEDSASLEGPSASPDKGSQSTDSTGGTSWKVRIVIQSLSHVQLFVTPPMNCNTPGSPVLHDFLPECAQVNVQWVHWWCYLTISSSAALSSFCLQYFPAFQALSQWVSSSRQVAESEHYLTHCHIILRYVCVGCSVVSDPLRPHGL